MKRICWIRNRRITVRSHSLAVYRFGFKDYFAHEFIPKRTPLESLAEATTPCDL